MVKPALPPQAQKIYTLLLEKGDMGAKDIGTALGIFPQAVYRQTQRLVSLGCIREVETHPFVFSARGVDEAANSFLWKNREWFMHAFLHAKQTPSRGRKIQVDRMDLSFMQTRQESYERFAGDLMTAKKSANLIVSGLEMPAEQMLACKQALERGVAIKLLVQTSSLENRQMLRNWQKLGIEIRAGTNIDARLLLVDEGIAYLLSYDPQKPDQAMGVRFVYGPIAFLLGELFAKRWMKAIAVF